jgi:hypothetical protein
MQIIAALLLLSAAHASPSLGDLSNFRSKLGWNPQWQPKTEGWQRYMDRKMAQVSRIEDTQQKFDGYLVAVGQGKEK